MSKTTQNIINVKPIDGTKPESFLAYEATIERHLQAQGGALLLEHMTGRHDYALTDGNPPVATVDPDSALRAPSPITEADNVKLRYIANRTLMQTDPLAACKMTAAQWNRYAQREFQMKYFDIRETAVKKALFDTTAGRVKTALTDSTMAEKSAFEHFKTVKTLSGVMSKAQRDNMVTHLTEGRIHDENKYIGMKPGDSPYEFGMALQTLRTNILRYTSPDDRASIETKTNDTVMVAAMKRSVTKPYMQCLRKFADLPEDDQNFQKLIENLQAEYYMIKDMDEKERLNTRTEGAVVATATAAPGPQFDGHCHNCGKYGHRARECRSAKKQQQHDRRDRYQQHRQQQHQNLRQHQQQHPQKMCRYGAKCFRRDCAFRHPHGHSPDLAKRQYERAKRERGGESQHGSEASNVAKVYQVLGEEQDGESSLSRSKRRRVMAHVARAAAMFPIIMLQRPADASYFGQAATYGRVRYAVWDGGAAVSCSADKADFIPGTLKCAPADVEGCVVEVVGQRHQIRGIGAMAIASHRAASGDIIVIVDPTAWLMPADTCKGTRVISKTRMEALGACELRATATDKPSVFSTNGTTDQSVPVVTRFGVATVDTMPTKAAALRFANFESAMKGGLHVAYAKGHVPSAVAATLKTAHETPAPAPLPPTLAPPPPATHTPSTQGTIMGAAIGAQEAFFKQPPFLTAAPKNSAGWLAAASWAPTSIMGPTSMDKTRKRTTEEGGLLLTMSSDEPEAKKLRTPASTTTHYGSSFGSSDFVQGPGNSVCKKRPRSALATGASESNTSSARWKSSLKNAFEWTPTGDAGEGEHIDWTPVTDADDHDIANEATNAASQHEPMSSDDDGPATQQPASAAARPPTPYNKAREAQVYTLSGFKSLSSESDSDDDITPAVDARIRDPRRYVRHRTALHQQHEHRPQDFLRVNRIVM